MTRRPLVHALTRVRRWCAALIRRLDGSAPCDGADVRAALAALVAVVQDGLRPQDHADPELPTIRRAWCRRQVTCLRRARWALGLPDDWRDDVLGPDWRQHTSDLLRPREELP